MGLIWIIDELCTFGFYSKIDSILSIEKWSTTFSQQI